MINLSERQTNIILVIAVSALMLYFKTDMSAAAVLVMAGLLAALAFGGSAGEQKE